MTGRRERRQLRRASRGWDERYVVLVRTNYVRQTTRYEVWDKRTEERIAADFVSDADAEQCARRRFVEECAAP